MASAKDSSWGSVCREGGHLLAGDLLLEERAQHDGGRAGVLERAHGVEVVGEGAGARRSGGAGSSSPR